MYKTALALGALAFLTTTVTAHGTVQGVTINGQFVGGFQLNYYYSKKYNQPVPENIGWYAENLDNGFVATTAYGSPDIICHINASPVGSSNTMAKVAAGATFDIHWTPWPKSHIGAMITYVAPYTGNISDVQKEDLKWTKIDAHGYENGQWASLKMIDQNNTWPVTVPSTLKAGNYVFRHETIALHEAETLGGAQNYPQCFNIEITGSGTQVPEGVLGTALYQPSEDGILFNPYVPSIKYNVPGPPLYGAASNDTATTPTQPINPPADSPTPSPSNSPDTTAPTPKTGDSLPQTFTMDTFIQWLETKTGVTANVRRHARSLF